MVMVTQDPDIRFRAARKLMGMEKIIPKKVAIIPMKIVSIIRPMVSFNGSLAEMAPVTVTCLADTWCICSPRALGGISR